MKKYVYALIIFGLMFSICLFYPPNINEMISENFIVMVVLFIIAHLLKLNLDKNITTVGDAGVYLMAIFTLSFKTALFSILLFSLIGFTIDLRINRSQKSIGNFTQSLISLSRIYIVFIFVYLLNKELGQINLIIRYITMIVLIEIMISIPYIFRVISTKITSNIVKEELKYYLLSDFFFAVFFFPFIYLYEIKNYELYNLYLTNVILFYFIIYYLVKNMWIHMDYLFSLIRLQELADSLSKKKNRIDIISEVSKFIPHLLEKKLVKLGSNLNFVPTERSNNIWNVGVEKDYISKIFVDDSQRGEIDIYTKLPIIERERILITLLIKQIKGVSRHKKVNERIQHDFFAVLESLIDLIEAKDPYSAGHSKRVSFYAEKIADIISPENKKRVRLSALLHDIGKLKIPTEILTKKGKLSGNEYDLIKQHPIFGFEMLINLKGLDDIADGVLYHHERLDGSGYPYGLSGESIPQIARIINVADMYDAMTSDRPYRKKMSNEQCFSILKEKARNNKIDGTVVEALIETIGKKKNGKI